MTTAQIQHGFHLVTGDTDGQHIFPKGGISVGSALQLVLASVFYVICGFVRSFAHCFVLVGFTGFYPAFVFGDTGGHGKEFGKDFWIKVGSGIAFVRCHGIFKQYHCGGVYA